VRRSYEVNGAAAVTGFIGLKGGLAVASGAGTKNGPFLVIVHDPIVEDCGVRSADDQNPFISRVLHRESRNGYIVEAGIVVAVHKDAIGKAGGVNDGRTGAGADE